MGNAKPGEAEKAMPVEVTAQQPAIVEAGARNTWEAIIDNGITRVANAIESKQQLKHAAAMENLKVDKGILTVFSVAFLGAMGFTFYLVLGDRVSVAAQFSFPLATAILGFLTGYFAGSRGGASRGK
jgi:uncharacterized membrane protein